MKRPDLAGSENLSKVQAPTLLIIGGNDEPVIEMNKDAFEQLTHLQDDEKKKKIIIIPGATHLFEEPGKLEEVADLAKVWFQITFKILNYTKKNWSSISTTRNNNIDNHLLSAIDTLF